MSSGGGEISVRFSSEEDAKLWQAFSKLAGNLRKSGDEGVKAARGIGSIDPEVRRLIAAGEALKTTPLERYDMRIRKINESFKGAARQSQEYGLAMRGAIAKLNEDNATLAAKQAVGAGPSGAIDKAANSQRKLRDETLRSVEAQQQLTRETSQFASRMEQRFSAMGAALKGAFAVGGVYALQVLREMRAEADASAAAVRASGDSLGKLAQLGNPALNQMAREARRTGAVSSMGEAVQSMFALESAGATSEQKTFFDLRRAGVIGDIGGTAKAAASLRAAMGEQEAGRFEQVIAKAFAASKYSPATVEQIVQSSGGKAGTFAAQQGITDEELIAAVARVSQTTRAPETAGEYVAALLQKTSERDDLRNKPLVDVLNEINAKQMEPAELTKYFGSVEAATAYRVLASDLPLLTQIMGDVKAANDKAPELIAERIALAMKDPATRAAVAMQSAEGRLELAKEARGQVALRSQAVSAEAVSAIQEGRIRGQESPFLTMARGAVSPGGVLARSLAGRMGGREAARGVDASVAARALDAARYVPGVDDLLSRRMGPGPREETPAERAQKWGAEDRAVLGEQMKAAAAITEAAKALKAAAQPRFDYGRAVQRDQAVEAH